MASTVSPNTRPAGNSYMSDSDNDAQASGGRRALGPVGAQAQAQAPSTTPSQASGLRNQPVGSLIKGATDANGNLKDAALLLGIKLDLEADINLQARIKGDITIGLY